MTVLELKIKTLSPIHLSSGAADVIVDSDVASDKYGMPVFSGRRLKGLLHESALEVVGMKGMAKYGKWVEKLFQHDCSKSCPEALTVTDLHLASRNEYMDLCRAFEYLQSEYGAIVSANDVLGEFTSIRYQTKMKDGLVEKGSFRNMRVVDEGVEFFGSLEAESLEPEAVELLALSARNLRSAGMKRNRGFGRISCSIKLDDNRTEQDIIDEIFGKEAK
ncbi:RAMP superfamily CRISPR-associated protein [Anaerovibrio sp. RM50]|uniref:RAMP superfamily CRISPR-associated protein n=1 Tax=Anaerovibrio sp. RM50 TaxID=1200557 RepID=UPI00048525BC|nr:RAMP superfamily CRISPR-associated protein [Anaerovibrio sp. RM50]